jgi:hypothetical protein
MAFVLFAHGEDTYSKQAYLASKSILQKRGNERVVLYTSGRIPNGEIEVRALNKFELEAWRGPLRFNHRQKVGMLIRAVLELGDNEPICYLDSDMYCQEFPPELSRLENEVLMFENEGLISESFHPRIYRFLAKNREKIAAAGYPDLQPSLTMHNCGLICLPPSSKRLQILEEVLRLTDFLCLNIPQQTTWLEQAAFSHLLPRYHAVANPSGGLIHYWGCNSEVAFLLKDLSFADLDAIAADDRRFFALLEGAKRMQATGINRIRQRIKAWKRSIKKRFDIRRAQQLARLD